MSDQLRSRVSYHSRSCYADHPSISLIRIDGHDDSYQISCPRRPFGTAGALCSSQGARGVSPPPGRAPEAGCCGQDGRSLHLPYGSRGDVHPLGPDNGLPRKEVIQPHLPVRLPCYDFTPLTLHTFDASAPFRGSAGGFGCRRLGWCDGRCVQGPGTYSPRRADPRLLATPASRRRVAACDPNWGRL